jgi:hypothetical protein
MPPIRKTVLMPDGEKIPKAQIEMNRQAYLICPYCGGLCEASDALCVDESDIEKGLVKWGNGGELTCLECGKRLAWPADPFRVRKQRKANAR